MRGYGALGSLYGCGFWGRWYAYGGGEISRRTTLCASAHFRLAPAGEVASTIIYIKGTSPYDRRSPKTGIGKYHRARNSTGEKLDKYRNAYGKYIAYFLLWCIVSGNVGVTVGAVGVRVRSPEGK